VDIEKRKVLIAKEDLRTQRERIKTIIVPIVASFVFHRSGDFVTFWALQKALSLRHEHRHFKNSNSWFPVKGVKFSTTFLKLFFDGKARGGDPAAGEGSWNINLSILVWPLDMNFDCFEFGDWVVVEIRCFWTALFSPFATQPTCASFRRDRWEIREVDRSKPTGKSRRR